MINSVTRTINALFSQACHDHTTPETNYAGKNVINAVKMTKRIDGKMPYIITLHDVHDSGWQAHAIVSELPDVVVTYNGEQRHGYWNDKGFVSSYWTVKDESRLVRRS